MDCHYRCVSRLAFQWQRNCGNKTAHGKFVVFVIQMKLSFTGWKMNGQPKNSHCRIHGCVTLSCGRLKNVCRDLISRRTQIGGCVEWLGKYHVWCREISFKLHRACQRSPKAERIENVYWNGCWGGGAVGCWPTLQHCGGSRCQT